MLTRLLTALFALSIIASFTLPASALEDASARRARQQREAQEYPNQAREAYNKNDYDLAIALYTKAIESGAFNNQPDTMGELYFGRGLSFQTKKDCPSAIKDFDKAATYVNKGNVFFARAICHLNLNQDDAALVDLDLAIKADPNAVDYRSARCIALFNRKDFAGALPDCEMVIASNAKDKKNVITAAAQSAEQIGDRKRAGELYRQLLALDPGNMIATEGLKRVGG